MLALLSISLDVEALNMTDGTLHDGQSSIAPGLTGALVISTVELSTDGILGLTHCPGRNHVDSGGRRWRRSLDEDLDSITRWGADGIVTLVETHELETLGVAGLPRQLAARGLPWFHLPIKDMHAPGETFARAWQSHGAAVFDALSGGGRLVVHCAAGLGRTGMIAAKLLVASGMAPLEAIALVRERRPGTIETQTQFDYVLSNPPLLRP